MTVTKRQDFQPKQLVVQSSPQLSGIIEPLLHALFPQHTVFTADVDDLPAYLTEPILLDHQRERLGEFLGELARRPEWAERGTLFREITDAVGTRFDVRVPLVPQEDPGAGVYGPFPTPEAARVWTTDNAPYSLESDVYNTPAGPVVELFRLA